MRRLCFPKVCLAIAVTFTGHAALAQHAPPPTTRLEYTRGRGAELCPAEGVLRDAVDAKLGYDPFDPGSRRVVIASVAKAGSGLRAQIRLLDAQGTLVGERELVSQENDCTELTSAVALAISIAIDPFSLMRSAPKLTPSIAPVAPAPAPAPGSSPSDPPAAIEGRFGILAALGSAPRIVPGIAAAVGLKWRRTSLSLEGRADLPASMPAPSGGAVQASLLVGEVVGCVHGGVFFGCAIAGAGVMNGGGTGVPRPEQAVSPYAAAGPRVGGEVRLSDRYTLRLQADALAPLIRTTLRLDGQVVWVTPPLSAALGIGFVGTFR